MAWRQPQTVVDTGIDIKTRDPHIYVYKKLASFSQFFFLLLFFFFSSSSLFLLTSLFPFLFFFRSFPAPAPDACLCGLIAWSSALISPWLSNSLYLSLVCHSPFCCSFFSSSHLFLPKSAQTSIRALIPRTSSPSTTLSSSAQSIAPDTPMLSF